MTQRERKERKLQKRLDWAESREKKVEQETKAEQEIGKHIPVGQPILTGHHSEKRHRKDIKRIQGHATKAVEHSNMAKHHREKADNLQHQLDTTIFSDDPDAVEQLQAKIEKLEKQRDRIKQVNKVLRNLKKGKHLPEGFILSTAEKKILAANNQAWGEYIFPKYMLTNISQRIRQAKNRLEKLQGG